jgi:hypothetical protein
MATTLVKITELSRVGASAANAGPGGIPASRVQILSTSDKWAGGVIEVGTTAVALPPGSVTAGGWVFLKNDSTAVGVPTVEYGIMVSSVFQPVGVLRPGFGWHDLGVVGVPGNIYLKASASATPVSYVINAIAV